MRFSEGSSRFIGSCAQVGRAADLALSDHVHVCTTVDGSVILDLKRDKYLGLGRDETVLISTLVDEWPKPDWTRWKEADGIGGTELEEP